MSEGERKLELLLSHGDMIAREVELDVLLMSFERRVAQAMRADRATLWILDAATGEIRTRVANLPEVPELRLPVGTGIAGDVARRGETVNIADARSDPRWAPEIDERTGYRTVSVLSVPILDRRRRVRGWCRP